MHEETSQEEERSEAVGERNATRKCRTCMNWNMKNNPQMARQGFGTCNLQVSKAVSYPPHHTCTAFKTVKPAQAAARDAWLKSVGVA